MYTCFYSWTHRKKQLAKIVIFCIAVFVVCFGFDVYRYQMEASVLNVVRPNGVRSFLDKKLLIMDNGPFSFGSWHLVELKQDVPIVKTFALPATLALSDRVVCRLDMIWMTPGSFTFEINGKQHVLRELQPCRKTFEFTISSDETSSITIIPRDIDCKAFVFIDLQRNYSRTLINGKNAGGELVCQLLF